MEKININVLAYSFYDGFFDGKFSDIYKKFSDIESQLKKEGYSELKLKVYNDWDSSELQVFGNRIETDEEFLLRIKKKEEKIRKKKNYLEKLKQKKLKLENEIKEIDDV